MKQETRWEIYGIIIIVVFALLAHNILPNVKGIMETIVVVVILIPCVIGGSIIYVAYQMKKQAIRKVKS